MVERVVVRGERARAGAAGERLQRRRFNLDEVAFVQPLADLEHDLVAFDEEVARIVVGEQVELAVAVARACVAEPVVLVRRRAQRLGQQRALADSERELPALGDVDDAVDATMSPMSRPRMRSYVSCPSASTRTTAWIDPDRSRMSRNAVLPCPLREMMRPAIS